MHHSMHAPCGLASSSRVWNRRATATIHALLNIEDRSKIDRLDARRRARNFYSAYSLHVKTTLMSPPSMPNAIVNPSAHPHLPPFTKYTVTNVGTPNARIEPLTAPTKFKKRPKRGIEIAKIAIKATKQLRKMYCRKLSALGSLSFSSSSAIEFDKTSALRKGMR